MNAHLRKHSPQAAKWIGRAYLRPGDHVIDVGACEGVFAEIWAPSVRPNGVVLAVDPDASSPRRAHTARWEIAAVGAEPGEVACYLADEPKHSSVYAANVRPGTPSIDVPMTTIDALVETLPSPPRLIKVDAQGAELAILRGATRALSLPIVWVVELWNDGLTRAGASVLEVLQVFRANRYEPRTVYGQPVTWRKALADATARHKAGSVDLLLVPAALR